MDRLFGLVSSAVFGKRPRAEADAEAGGAEAGAGEERAQRARTAVRQSLHDGARDPERGGRRRDTRTRRRLPRGRTGAPAAGIR